MGALLEAQGSRAAVAWVGIQRRIMTRVLFNNPNRTPLAANTQARNSNPASSDSPAIAELKAAGAVYVGKTHMDELAFSIAGDNWHFGCCANSAAPGYAVGGSSSGSAAAVAAGAVDFALGSDTCGSVRVPAA